MLLNSGLESIANVYEFIPTSYAFLNALGE